MKYKRFGTTAKHETDNKTRRKVKLSNLAKIRNTKARTKIKKNKPTNQT